MNSELKTIPKISSWLLWYYQVGKTWNMCSHNKNIPTIIYK